MPTKLPEEITSREGYKLICDEIEKAHNEVKESKQFTPYVILQAGCSKPAPVMNARIEAVQ